MTFDQVKMVLYRRHDRDRYLIIQSDIVLPQPSQEYIANLPPEQRDDLVQAIAIAMAQERVEFVFVAPFQNIHLEKPIHLGSDFSEETFTSGLNDVEFSTIIAKATLKKEADQFKSSVAPDKSKTTTK
jgi:hypothetical protein